MADKKSLPIDGNTLAPPPPRGRKLAPAPKQTATTLYAGLFEQGTPGSGYGLYNTPSWQDFLNNWQQAMGQGLRLCSIDTDEETQGNRAYLGVYVQMAGEYGLWSTPDWNSFLGQFNSWGSSMRLLDLDIHPHGGQRWYTGTWGGAPVNQTLVHDLSWDDFIAKWQELSAANMRLMKVQVFPAADGLHLTGLFEPGASGYAFVMWSDWNAFLQYYTENQGAMELTDFQVFDQPPTRWYVGVWNATQLGHSFLYDLDWGSFVNKWGELSDLSMRLKKAVRYANPIELPEPNWADYF